MPNNDEPKKSEIREDYVQDRFVIIAPRRGKRPHDEPPVEEPEVTSRENPFVKEETYKDTLHEVPDADGGWKIRVVPNPYAAVSKDNPDAYGMQEVVVETPEFGVALAEMPVDRVVDLLKTYAARVKAISEDPKIRYILVFKNKGGKAGASLRHSHSQIFAAGFVPPHIDRKLKRLRKFREDNGIGYYEHLLSNETGSRYIASDEKALAFAPYASLYPYEAWILPREQVDNISLLDNDQIESIAGLLHMILRKLHKHGFPYNFYMHQTVEDDDEHFYLRVAPRVNTWAGVELGSRLIINEMLPEEAAKFYRSK